VLLGNLSGNDRLHQRKGLGELALARRGGCLRSGFVIV
jgi:hypothetical protein